MRTKKCQAIMPGRNYNGRNSYSVGLGGGHADRRFRHRGAVDLVVDHDALVIAVGAEIDALLARRFSQAGRDPAHHNFPTRCIRIPGA